MRKAAHITGDARRKHRHWKVTIYYYDGQKFSRIYIDRKRAEKFAERQKRSPVVRSTRIREVL
jgi:plasmid stabilization system protein ParE